MSKTGQASDRPSASDSQDTGHQARRSRRRAATGRWLLHLVLRPLLAIPVLAVGAGALLALRLAMGPLEVSWLVHAVTPLPLGGRTGGQDGHAPGSSWASLRIGRAWIGWNGSGAGGGVMLRLEDVSVVRAGGAVADHVGQARFTLGLAALLRGVPDMREIAVSGARLQLRRDEQSGLGLGLSPVGQAAPDGSSGPVARFDHLRRVTLSDMQLSVQDLVVHRDWIVRDVSIDAGPGEGGIVGHVAATVRLGGKTGTVGLSGDGRADPDQPGLVDWHLSLGPVLPADLAGALPALQPLSAVALPVSTALDVSFAGGAGRFMEPVQAALSVSLGQGALVAGRLPIPVRSGELRVVARLLDGLQQRVELQLERASLQLGDTTGGPAFRAAGAMSLDSLDDPRRIRAFLSVDSPRIGFVGLDRYWPEQVARGARRWILANITAGEATALHVETSLAGDQGWGSIVETRRSGGFDADGLTLWWLRPIPPLQGMSAHLALQGPDALTITVPQATLPVQGRVGTLSVRDSTMRITGLSAKDQIGTVTVHLGGDLGDLLAELAHPRLNLLSAHPVSFTRPSGRTQSDVTVSLPLDNKVSIAQVSVQDHSRIEDGHLGNVVAGRSLDDAALDIAATTDGLSVDGTGKVGGIPARLHYAMDFRAGPPDQLTEQARVQAVVTAGILRLEGLDPSGLASGEAGLSVAYDARRSGLASVSLGLDLTGLGLDSAVWSKRAGIAASAAARIGLLHGRLVSIDRLSAQGPGLSIEAQGAVSGGRAQQVTVARFEVGRSRGSGRIVLPAPTGGRAAAPIRIEASGPVLDLAPVIKGDAAASKPVAAAVTPAADQAPVSWIADLTFGRVFVGAHTALDGVRAHVEDDGARISRAHVSATGPARVTVDLSPRAGGRALAGSIDDTGALLRGLGVTDTFAGGALDLAGIVDDRAGGTITGLVRIGRFVLPDAPRAARIARDASLYGWLMALPSPQLGVDRLVAPFTYRAGVLRLSEARAHSTALGVTVRGDVDLSRKRLDLRGTLVPAWAINQLPGRLPLVGRFLVPETGGGLFAATVRITGRFGAPDVHVNLLSALAPGPLRRLLFDQADE